MAVVWIDIHKKVTLSSVEEGQEQDVMVVNHTSSQAKPESREARVNKSHNSRNVLRVLRDSDHLGPDGLLHFWEKIYVPQSTDLHRCIVSLYYDTKIAGHLGYWKTLELISQDYWWPQISWYIKQYVSICDLYLQTKPSITNFIRPYLYQIFNNSHDLNGTQKPLKRTFDWYQSHLEAINSGWDIRQINR